MSIDIIDNHNISNYYVRIKWCVFHSFIVPLSLTLSIWSESSSVVSGSLWPQGLYSPWNSPGQNTGVGSLSLLQGMVSTQGSNPGLPLCRQILYQLSHEGSPYTHTHTHTHTHTIIYSSLTAQMVNNLTAMQETWIQSLGWDDPLEKGMATRSSILAWRIPWTEEPGGL